MKLKLLDIVNGHAQMNHSKLFRKDLAPIAALKLNLTVKKLDAIIESFREQEKKMYEEFGEKKVSEDVKTKGQEFWKIPDEKIEDFQEKHKSLLEGEIEVNIIPISIEHVNEPLKPSEISMYCWIFEEYSSLNQEDPKEDPSEKSVESEVKMENTEVQ